MIKSALEGSVFLSVQFSRLILYNLKSCTWFIYSRSVGYKWVRYYSRKEFSSFKSLHTGSIQFSNLIELINFKTVLLAWTNPCSVSAVAMFLWNMPTFSSFRVAKQCFNRAEYDRALGVIGVVSMVALGILRRRVCWKDDKIVENIFILPIYWTTWMLKILSYRKRVKEITGA